MNILVSLLVLAVEIILGVIGIFILFCLALGALGVFGWGMEKFTNAIVKHWKVFAVVMGCFYVGLAVYSCLFTATSC